MRFRFRKDSIVDLVNIIQTDLEHQTRRGHEELLHRRCNNSSWPCDFMPLAALRKLLAIYLTCLYSQHAKQFTRCRGHLPNERHMQFMSFNTCNLCETKRNFYAVSHFPGVLGAIYCTHIRTICPAKDNAMIYVNRKQFYLINVQAICDSEACITGIVARWPRSTHDSRIYDNSAYSWNV